MPRPMDFSLKFSCLLKYLRSLCELSRNCDLIAFGPCEKIAGGIVARLLVSKQVIDSKGFRYNVGMILFNDSGRLFWCKRLGQDAWQFPQGGLQENETAEDALFRELEEETGLQRKDVKIYASSKDWLHYRIPENLVRKSTQPKCIGQKQRWFLLKMVGGEDHINLQSSSDPEFDRWCWTDYWTPVKEVIFFKRDVYQTLMDSFAPLLDS